ncbi:aromatic compound dioxygenase [Phellopilus nigrolimitatus]|nr:aromatic compound dioxygenase [Phellopilus nigrolimitatus]
MLILPCFSLIILFTGYAIAHSGNAPTGAALHRRLAHNARVQRDVQKRCASAIAKRKSARFARRAEHGYRSFHAEGRAADAGVCILTPEVTQGPYHVLGELVVQNVTQSQPGVPLEIDVEFIDIDTCEPVPKVWVDAWSCNATGIYSGYTNAGPPLDLPPVVSAVSPGPYDGADVPGSVVYPGPTDNFNFLRGVWQADEFGHYTFYTNVPGWYTHRSAHVHIKVYNERNGSIADNGTFVAGTALHTGQFFFAEEFMETIGNMTPYKTNTVVRYTNAQDEWYGYENADGYDALLDIAQVSENLSDGVIGSIIVGLNMSYVSAEVADGRWGGNGTD